MSHTTLPKRRTSLNVAHLFIALHYFFVVYINSTYIGGLVGTSQLSLLYIAGSILSLILFFSFATLARRFHNYDLTLIFITLEALAIAGMAFAKDLVLVQASFLLFIVLSPIIFLNLDVFLEKLTTDEKKTGTLRGIFRLMLDGAAVISPFIVSYLIVGENYTLAYSASLVALILGLVAIATRLDHIREPRYCDHDLFSSIKTLAYHPHLKWAMLSQLILYYFFAWLVLYVPLFLHGEVGIPWSVLGILISISLTPFAVLDYPLGRLMDSIGEQGVMFIGYIIITLGVLMLAFDATQSVVYWGIALFCARLGGAFVESGTEAHFFRHVSAKDADVVSIFRAARPLNWILASLVASVLLVFTSYTIAFYVLAFVCAFGIYVALRIPR